LTLSSWPLSKETTDDWRAIKLTAAFAAGIALCASTAMAETITFGSANDGLGGFTHTAIDSTNTFLTTEADSVEYRNQNLGTVDAAFIRQFSSIDRTPDSGKIYTVTGTSSLSDGYADDNNRLGLVLFTDPTTVLSRNNLGQIGIIWNSDDGSAGAGPTGNNAQDNLKLLNGYNATDADVAVTPLLRDQTIQYAQDLYQGTQVTFSATFWFTGADINIDAFMTDAGGVTSIGTARVLAADFTGDYFGFASAYRARNYDGTPDPTGAARDNPLVQDYESFSLSLVPEPTSLFLALAGLGFVGFRRRRA
jgi:hypothetical protein